MITIDISHLEPKYQPKYAILFDRTVEQIVEYADANPEVFIFPIAAKSAYTARAYSALMKPPLVDKYGDWIVMPIYVDLLPVGSTIQQIIGTGMGRFYEDAECILNELELP